MRIGVFCVRGSVTRTGFTNSGPLIPGSMKSEIIASNGGSSTSKANALSASCTVVTCATGRRTSASSEQTAASSSAIKTRWRAGMPGARDSTVQASAFPSCQASASGHVVRKVFVGMGASGLAERRMAPMRAALLLLLVLFLAPLVNLVLAVPPAEIAAALGAPATLAAIRVSLFASLAAVALASALGVPAAYALSRAAQTGRNG